MADGQLAQDAPPDAIGADEPPPAPPSGTSRAISILARWWILLFLLAIIAYFTASSPSHAFFETDNFKNIALDTSEVILIGVGETFVILTAGIDLSVGGILVFSGVAGGLVMLNLSGTKAQTDALVYPHAARAIPVGVAVMLLCGVGWGLLNGLLVTRLRLPPFIVTLGTLGMAFGGADLLTGGSNLSSVPTSFQDNVGNGKLLGLYVPVLIAAVVVVIAQVVLSQARFGRWAAAIGSNEEAARRAGVNTDLHLVKVYGLSGLLCGVAAAIDVARFGTENLSAHNTDNLNAIAAVVIGGTSLFGGIGSIVGNVVGGVLPTVPPKRFVVNRGDPLLEGGALWGTVLPPRLPRHGA